MNKPRFYFALPVLFALTILMNPNRCTASDRANHLTGKDEDRGPLRSLVLSGLYVHNIGNLQMNVTNWGFLGSLPKARYPMSGSPSAQWPAGSGIEFLYAAGLWIGAQVNGNPYVSTGWPETEFYPTTNPIDVIYRTFEGELGGRRYPDKPDDDSDGRIDEDWLNGHDDDGDGYTDEDFAAIGQQMFSCWYTDDQPTSQTVWPEHTPMHIDVRQETFQWGDNELGNFIGATYYITNIGNDFLTDVYLGIYADVDAGPVELGTYHLDDRIGFWSGRRCVTRGNAEFPVDFKIAYVFDEDGDGGKTKGYFGIMIIGHPGLSILMPATQVNLNAFRAFRGLQPFENGGEPTNDFERYNVLSTRRFDEDNGNANDYKILLSAGPFYALAPSSTIELHVVFVAGEGLEGMLKNAAQAALLYKGIWFDKDGDPKTGQIGRETPYPGKKKDHDPDDCDGEDEKVQIERGEIYWSNVDCSLEGPKGCYTGTLTFQDYQTGVQGREGQALWVTGSAPPPPNLRTVPGDMKVLLFWDNLSETIPDIVSKRLDFEGYQVWRADGWHRPFGTSILTGPNADLWHLLEIRDLRNRVPPNVDFKKPYSQGGWQYEPLQDFEKKDIYLQMYEEVLWYNPLDSLPCPPGITRDVCDTLEALARYNLGFEGGRQYYKFVHDDAKNGLPYFYAVTAYDHIYDSQERPFKIGRETSPAANFQYVSPQSSAQEAEVFQEREVYVVPNPASRESLQPWQLDSNDNDPTGLKVEFRNLPRCRCTVRIFTVAGDLVQILYHDGSGGNGTLAWDLLSRNGQEITSGVYLFSVSPDESRFPKAIGKFVVIM